MNKVLVAGSINMDIVVFSNTHPNVGETVFGDTLKYFPGGKGANQAVASAKMNVETAMIGAVGGDNFGAELKQYLKEQNVDTHIRTSEQSPTGTALITVSKETSDNTIVVVPGANFDLNDNDVADAQINKSDVLVSQFEIPTETIYSFFKSGKLAGTINVLNPAPAKEVPVKIMELVDILIVNETELETISQMKIDIDKQETINSAVDKIKTESQSVIVTLGKHGALGYFQNTITKVEGKSVKAVDTTGAGDCFVGSLSAMLALGKSPVEAMEYANKAASICVTREGASPSMPSFSEVETL